MDMCYSEAMVMPRGCEVMDCEEMEYIDGGKSYYNKAGTLANTCQVCSDIMLAEASILPAIALPGVVTSVICSHNANMYIEAKGKCSNYSANTYITLQINYSGLIISSTSVKKGK